MLAVIDSREWLRRSHTRKNEDERNKKMKENEILFYSLHQVRFLSDLLNDKKMFLLQKTVSP